MAFTNAQLKIMSNDIYIGMTEKSNLPFLANTRWNRPAQDATEVTILGAGDVTFNTVVNGTPATPQSPAPDANILKIDTAKDFWLPIYETERLVPGYVQAVGQKAAAAAAALPDAAILALALKANVATGNWIAGNADAAIDVNGTNILAYLDQMYEIMRGRNVPVGEIYCALPQKLMTKVKIGIRKQGLPVQESASALFSGTITKVCGLNIVETNQYVSVTGGTTYDYNVLFGSADGIAAAYKPVVLKEQDIQLGWGSYLAGKIEFGQKIIDNKIVGAAYLNAVAEA